MVSKVFLDANVVLDFLLKRDAYEEVRKVISLIVKKKIQGFVTPAVVHIIGYWVTKSYGNRIAKELLLSLLADVHVIDCNHEITLHALNSNIGDVEDALQYYTAIHHKLTCFLSLDRKLQTSGTPQLPVYSPGEFLEMIQI